MGLLTPIFGKVLGSPRPKKDEGHPSPMSEHSVEITDTSSVMSELTDHGSPGVGAEEKTNEVGNSGPDLNGMIIAGSSFEAGNNSEDDVRDLVANLPKESSSHVDENCRKERDQKRRRRRHSLRTSCSERISTSRRDGDYRSDIVSQSEHHRQERRSSHRRVTICSAGNSKMSSSQPEHCEQEGGSSDKKFSLESQLSMSEHGRSEHRTSCASMSIKATNSSKTNGLSQSEHQGQRRRSSTRHVTLDSKLSMSEHVRREQGRHCASVSTEKSRRSRSNSCRRRSSRLRQPEREEGSRRRSSRRDGYRRERRRRESAKDSDPTGELPPLIPLQSDDDEDSITSSSSPANPPRSKSQARSSRRSFRSKSCGRSSRRFSHKKVEGGRRR